jgi:hypothetical protein
MLPADPAPQRRKGEHTMSMTVGRARSMAVSSTFALAIFIASAASRAAETSEAFIIPLFPQKEAELKKGLPPGMTAYSFWAGRGTAKLRRLADEKVEIVFDFDGLIPYGVYTLWNVVETNPFKDEPLGEFGAGKHSIVADGSGHAHKLVVIDKWPGKEFLLDYHSDGQLSQASGVYPGALWGKFPSEPKR